MDGEGRLPWGMGRKEWGQRSHDERCREAIVCAVVPSACGTLVSGPAATRPETTARGANVALGCSHEDMTNGQDTTVSVKKPRQIIIPLNSLYSVILRTPPL